MSGVAETSLCPDNMVAVDNGISERCRSVFERIEGGTGGSGRTHQGLLPQHTGVEALEAAAFQHCADADAAEGRANWPTRIAGKPESHRSGTRPI